MYSYFNRVMRVKELDNYHDVTVIVIIRVTIVIRAIRVIRCIRLAALRRSIISNIYGTKGLLKLLALFRLL